LLLLLTVTGDRTVGTIVGVGLGQLLNLDGIIVPPVAYERTLFVNPNDGIIIDCCYSV
jgi:hypothetical protein